MKFFHALGGMTATIRYLMCVPNGRWLQSFLWGLFFW